MHYTVEPGLYALGKPDSQSLVLVTANYKMSFDRLREALPDRNVWILVLDTKGINVWCSAGKGTFGTTELVNRIESTGIAQIVSHRELILPQLAGPGVAAHEVKRLSRFKIIYGPIKATDLTTFLDAGCRATPEMRLKTFTLWERAILIPMELIKALKVGLIVIPILFFFTYLWRLGEGVANALSYGLSSVIVIITSILVGAVFTPLLLPWLPGRAFSLKGLGLGLFAAGTLVILQFNHLTTWSGRMEILGWFLLIPALSAFLAMNFTGASTYTSLSGVKKEMRWALPLQIVAGIVGLLFWIASHFITKGV